MKNRWFGTTSIVVTVLAVLSVGSPAFAQAQPEPYVQPLEAPAPPLGYPPPGYAPAPYGAPPPGPARMRYEPGDPIPAGYHVVHRARTGLVIAGTITLAVSYGIAFSVAMIDDFKDETRSLVIPVAGPWLMMYYRSQPNCDSQTGNGCVERSLETVLRFYLAIDGLAQAAGVAMLAFGAAGRDILVRDGLYAQVRVVPAPIGSNGYGALMTGRF